MTNQNACLNMIKQQLRTSDVLDEHILELFEIVPRHDFVPPAMQQFAYSDLQIPLEYEERMMTPVEEGKILQALALQGNETVLEVGTGSGYFTALLSKLAEKVISIDYYETFTKAARTRLAQHQCNNVELITGDACNGWLEKAPYDVLIMTGAIDKITESLRMQVIPGGKMVVIAGHAPVMSCLLLQQDHTNNWSQTLLFETCLPPLINKTKRKQFVF